MQARLANAACRWQDVLKFADRAAADPQYRRAADLVRALALARSNKTREAIVVLDDITAAPETDVFPRARVSFIRVTTELVARGLPVPEEDGSPQGISIVSTPRSIAIRPNPRRGGEAR